MIDRVPLKKVDFSKFRYEKSELLWKDDYDYIPYLARMINFVVRKLLKHQGMDFKKALELIYEGQTLYQLMADWKEIGWEIPPGLYYRWYREEAELPQIEDATRPQLVPFDLEHENLIVAIETAWRRLGYKESDAFWWINEKVIGEAWTTLGRSSASAKEIEEYLKANCRPFGLGCRAR